jgi:Uma2 family endonuclease
MPLRVDIAGELRDAATLDRAAVETLLEAGALPNGGRVELLDGVLLPMAPSTRHHAAALAELTHAVVASVRKTHVVLVDPALFLADDAMLAPDILVLPKGADPAHVAGEDVDLIVEIADSTLSFDLRLKAERYGRFGVAEYWVVDLQNQRLHIHRAPSEDGYADIRALSWDEPAEALRAPALRLRLSDHLQD